MPGIQQGDLFSLSLLILPNVAAMSDAEAAAVRAFVRAGGALIATNETSLYDPSGAPRTDFALADVFGTQQPAGPVNRLLPPSLRCYPAEDAVADYQDWIPAGRGRPGGAGAVGPAGGARGGGRGGNAPGPVVGAEPRRRA